MDKFKTALHCIRRLDDLYEFDFTPGHSFYQSEVKTIFIGV